MARGINKVILIGNLGKDPETRYMPNGGAVTNITVATSETWKDKQSGQSQERTEWHNVVFFNRLAEIAGEYLKKGSKVYLEGSLRTRKWQDKSGADRYTTEIVASEMQMLDSRSGGTSTINNGQQGQQQYNQQQQYGQQPQNPMPPASQQQAHQYNQQGSAQNVGNQQNSRPDIGYDDDIPFFGSKTNCLADSLSSMTDIPLKEIPPFHEMAKSEWKSNLRDWLASINLSFEISAAAPKGKAIAVGNHKTGMLHAVVVKDGNFVFDPDPDGLFIENVNYYMQITPLQAA